MVASLGASSGQLASGCASGMLTVIVGRPACLPITVGEAAKVCGRLLALFGLALLEAAGVVAVLGPAVAIFSGVAAANEAAASSGLPAAARG